MKITFLIPPCFTKGETPAERSAGCTRIVYPFPNLYELGVAAVMEEQGHEVKLEDFVYDEHTPDDLRAFLKHDDSDLYVMWGVNLSIPDDVATIEMMKEERPQARVIMLGPSGTYFPDKFLSDAPETVIVRGEPEATLPQVVTAIENGTPLSDVKGVIISKDGRSFRTPPRPLIKDVDALPFPARHLLADRQYHNPKLKTGPYTTALTSRNCPFHCIYCVPSSLTFARELDFRHDSGRKPPIAFRSIESVDKEMKMLHDQGYRAIGFVDDNFIWNEERTLALCDIMRRYGFVWGCQARVDAITEPIAKALSESGCGYVDLGIESFDDEILKYVKKGITSAQIVEAVKLLKKYDVSVKLNILIGTSPLETKNTIKDTIRKAKKLKVDQVMINIISPFPGTEFYATALENGWIEGNEYRPTNVQRESILNYPHLKSRDMERLLFKSNINFFLDPRFVFRQLRKFRSWKEFRAAFKALKVKLFG